MCTFNIGIGVSCISQTAKKGYQGYVILISRSKKYLNGFLRLECSYWSRAWSGVPLTKDFKDTFSEVISTQFCYFHGYSSSLLFNLKNACAKKPCQNNSTCQAGFTDRDYRCLCIAGFTGHDCEVGKKYH